MTAYVSDHNLLPLLHFLRNDMITQVLAGLGHLSLLLFERFVNM